MISTLCSLSGLLLAIIRYESNTQFYDDSNGNDKEAHWKLRCVDYVKGLGLVYSYLIFALSILSVVFLALRNWYKVKWVNQYLSFITTFKDDKKSRNLFYYYNQTIVGNNQSSTETIKDSLVKEKSFFKIGFILQSFVLLIGPNPFFDKVISVDNSLTVEEESGVNVYYCLSDLFLAFMFFRLFFLYRTLVNYSDYTDGFSLKICK